MRMALNGNVKLTFDVEGSGPDLLLISGTASTRAIWSLVRPELAKSFRTIAFDNRDSGASSIASGPYALTDLARDAAAVPDAAGSKTAHIAGHSLGGAVAQEFALASPQRCRSLTLACAWAGSGATTLSEVDIWEKTDAAMALGALAPREALVRQWQLDFNVDTVARLSQLDVPSHVIWCSEDRLIPPSLSEALVRALRGAKETRIDGCGHLPMVDRPEDFVAAVHRIL